MYKARVESVSGTKVRAGGKWLTCIGNKNVRVGDSVWTDGRCVYGNHYEPQQPIVITGGKEDLAIPVQLNNLLFTFRKGELKQAVDEQGEPIKLSDEETVRQSKWRILNDTKSKVYSLDVAAANCKDNGDIYTLKNKATRYIMYNLHMSWDVKKDILDDMENFPDLNVEICKNDEVIKNVPFIDIVKEKFTDILDGAKSLHSARGYPDGWLTPWDFLTTNYDYTIYSQIVYSFIKNDINWAFIYRLDIRIDRWQVTSSNGEYTPSSPEETSPVFASQDGYCLLAQYYYFDSTGDSKLIYNHYQLAQWHQDDNMQLGGYHEFIKDDEDFDELQKIKYPLQDGYYFKMQIVPLKQDFILGGIVVVKNDIFSPKDILLFNCTEILGANFVITKLSAGKYLVGIRPYAIYRPVDYQGGLYICENGELKILIGEQGEYFCNNYRLRQMKKYKRWWKRIQKIEQEA